MKHKFNDGDRVVILGHENGPMKPGEHSRDDLRKGYACYISEMDEFIGREAVIVQTFIDKISGRARYYLNDAVTKEIIPCYWVEEWLSPAEMIPVVDIEVECLL